jgi:hypothetical protein
LSSTLCAALELKRPAGTFYGRPVVALAVVFEIQLAADELEDLASIDGAPGLDRFL